MSVECKKAGVKPFGFHAIRHLRASMLYRQECGVAEIQRVLRHKNPMTATAYLQLPGHKEVKRALEDNVGNLKVDLAKFTFGPSTGFQK